MAEGFEWTIFEIFEIIISVSLFILIGSAILVISDVNYLKAQAVSIETSYSASLISGKIGTIEINYPEIEEIGVELNGNKIITTISNNNKFNLEKNYIGEKNLEIKKEDNKITIISNG